MRTRAALTGGDTYPALALRGARLPLLLCACLAVSAAASLAASARPQRGESGVSGTVYDENGDVVANASVTAFNNASGVERRATTDGEGFFSIALLPAGTYSVIVRREGFKT
ncbi:MAG TPA: carboxypeptidase-like regulatory domain-containing protein, partial [Pyrinomonadaceae bacterium]|nr:carboxypeptidase-like regulatory domain-containing protein [Pyrinomonadaceae bacterium]